MAGPPAFCDGQTPLILVALRERPQSARDLAVTLGQSAGRSNAAALRAVLEWLERRGEVQRTRAGNGPWIWEVPDA